IYCGVPFESTLALAMRLVRPSAIHVGWARGGGVNEVKSAVGERKAGTPAVAAVLCILGWAQTSALKNLDFIFNGGDTQKRLTASVPTGRARVAIPNALAEVIGEFDSPDELQ